MVARPGELVTMLSDLNAMTHKLLIDFGTTIEGNSGIQSHAGYTMVCCHRSKLARGHVDLSVPSNKLTKRCRCRPAFWKRRRLYGELVRAIWRNWDWKLDLIESQDRRRLLVNRSNRLVYMNRRRLLTTPRTWRSLNCPRKIKLKKKKEKKQRISLTGLTYITSRTILQAVAAGDKRRCGT